MELRSILIALLAALANFVHAQAAPVPPKSISDILAILDQYRPDEKALETLRALASAPVPDTRHEQELAIFFHRRGRANRDLGNSRQEIADLETALSLVLPSGNTEGEGIGDRYRIMLDLIGAEIQGGNAPRGLQWATELLNGGNAWRRFWAHFNLAIASSFIADANRARQHLELMDQNLAEMRLWRDWTTYGDVWQSSADRAHGLYLDLVGNHGEGERRHRRAVELAEKHYWRAFDIRRYRNDATPQATALKGWAFTEAMLAKNLSQQGRASEAEYFARNALMRQLQASGRYSHHIVYPALTLASILFEGGHYAAAAALAGRAIEAAQAAGVTVEAPFLAESRAVVGDAAAALQHWDEANAVFELRDKALASNPGQYAYLKNGDNVVWAYSLLRSGETNRALAMAERIYTTRLASGLDEREYFTAQARGIYAMALAASGQPEKALPEFRGAVSALLEEARRRGGGEQNGAVARQMRLVWILEGYLRFLIERQGSGLLATAGIDAVAEAFRIADVARGSAVQRALAESAARTTPGDPALADLARREQDAQQRFASLSDLLNRLLSAPPEQRLDKVVADIRRDIEAQRAEREALKAELDRRFPEYAELIAPKPVTLAQAQAVLKDGEALVSIYVGTDRSYVWAVRKTGRPVFAEVAMGEAEATRRVADLRRALDIGDAPLEELPRFDMAQAHELYRRLLAPVEGGWRGANNVIVIAHKALGQLPFAVLTTDPSDNRTARHDAAHYAAYREFPWLIRRTALTQLPSVNTLLALRRTRPVAGERQPFIGFGDPVFSLSAALPANSPASARRRLRNLGIGSVATQPAAVLPEAPIVVPRVEVANSSTLAQLARLPDTAEEIGSIARALKADPAKDVFLGVAASESNVKAGQLDNRRVVMFATHGLVPGDLNGLTQPALALSAPEVTGNQNEDGLLTMEEVLGLRLNADWVVLSACNTAAGDGAGAEAVSGLGKAFFYAGARTLLVSNWPVETVSARLLTTRLFEAQANDPTLTRAEALRRTMLELLDKTESAELIDGKRMTYAHPMFWAPFSLVGDGER